MFLGNNRLKIKAIISCLVFLLILCAVFSKMTWIFRGNNIEARENIAGIKNENNLDVVFFGGSNVLRYVDPMKIWEEAGLTSYNYATSSGDVELYKFYADELLTHVTPSLFVFDIRPVDFQIRDFNMNGIYNWADSLDVFSWVRLKGVSSYLYSHGFKVDDIPSFYFDMIRYHTNYDSIKDPHQWDFIFDDAIYNICKGFSPYTNVIPFDKPFLTTNIKQNTEMQIDEKQKHVLLDLMNYCNDAKINALFIVCPCVMSAGECLYFDKIGEFIQSYGFGFINFNNYYDAIGLDFEFDFGDLNHINYVGAQKYTKYLSEYLCMNYDLTDHRDDPLYFKWNECYLEYEKYSENWDLTTRDAQINLFDANATGDTISKICDFDTWYDAVMNNAYSILIVDNGFEGNINNNSLNSFMKEIMFLDVTQLYAGVFSEGWQPYIVVSGHDEDRFVPPELKGWEPYVVDELNPYEGTIGYSGGRELPRFHISADDASSITIDDVEYMTPDKGIHMVVFDNNYLKVRDNVTIQIDNENIDIKHN